MSTCLPVSTLTDIGNFQRAFDSMSACGLGVEMSGGGEGKLNFIRFISFDGHSTVKQ